MCQLEVTFSMHRVNKELKWVGVIIMGLSPAITLDMMRECQRVVDH